MKGKKWLLTNDVMILKGGVINLESFINVRGWIYEKKKMIYVYIPIMFI